MRQDCQGSQLLSQLLAPQMLLLEPTHVPMGKRHSMLLGTRRAMAMDLPAAGGRGSRMTGMNGWCAVRATYQLANAYPFPFHLKCKRNEGSRPAVNFCNAQDNSIAAVADHVSMSALFSRLQPRYHQALAYLMHFEPWLLNVHFGIFSKWQAMRKARCMAFDIHYRLMYMRHMGNHEAALLCRDTYLRIAASRRSSTACAWRVEHSWCTPFWLSDRSWAGTDSLLLDCPPKLACRS